MAEPFQPAGPLNTTFSAPERHTCRVTSHNLWWRVTNRWTAVVDRGRGAGLEGAKATSRWDSEGRFHAGRWSSWLGDPWNWGSRFRPVDVKDRRLHRARQKRLHRARLSRNFERLRHFFFSLPGCCVDVVHIATGSYGHSSV